MKENIRAYLLSLTMIAITCMTGAKNYSYAAAETGYLPAIVSYLLIDGDPLIVESHIPNENETDVSRGIEVRIQFMSPLSDSTVTQDNIEVIGPLGAEPSQLTHADGLLVISPDNILDLSSTYTIVLQPRLRDTFGNRLAEVFSFSFTTTNLNSPPVARQVTISDDNGGGARVGDILRGEYEFFDVDFDNEGLSLYQWFRNDLPISDTNSTSYVLPLSDNGAAIRFQVQPIAVTGTLTGDSIQSEVLQTINLPAPVAISDDASTNEDTAFSFSATSNDQDADNNIDTASVDLDLASNGIQSTFTDANNNLWVAADSGEITFTPRLNLSGIQSIEYTVRDLDGLESNSAFLTVTVVPVNDPPVAIEDSESTPASQSIEFNIILNDQDVEGNLDSSTVDLNPQTPGIQQNLTSSNGDLWTVDDSGNLTFNLVAPGLGPRSISYVISDTGGALSNIAVITVNIIEEPPVVDTTFRSCAHALEDGQTTNGVYLISADGIEEAHRVFCDQNVDGGGWTLVGSTQNTTLNDESSDYYSDLERLAPNSANTGIWDGLRSLGSRWDVRFTCRASIGEADQAMDVDLSFYDVNWYDEFTTGSDEDSCFSESSGSGADSPVPARRDNISNNFRRKTDQYDAGYLEGEDFCASTDDFTVDFDNRGMDSDTSDGTDWGEDDASRKCGTAGLASGQWFVFARERPRVAVVGLGSATVDVLRDESILVKRFAYSSDVPSQITTENFDTLVIGRYANSEGRLTQAMTEAIATFGRNGGNIVTEWDGSSLFMSSYTDTYRYSNSAPDQIDWFFGRMGAGNSLGDDTPISQVALTDPIFNDVPNPILGGSAGAFFFTIEGTFPGFLGTGHETLATFPGDGSTAYPNATYPAITRGRYCGGQFISTYFDWQDNPSASNFGPLVANMVKNASTPSPSHIEDACPIKMRSHFAVCGSSDRDLSEFIENSIQVDSCTPNNNMQVMYITRTGVASLNGAQLRSYLNDGGIIITEYSSSDDVYNEVFFGDVDEGEQFGNCRDNVMPVTQDGSENGFWQENLFETSGNTSGCGKDISQFPNTTRLGGWDDTTTQLAYRDQGLGRVWFVEADWQDGNASMTEQSKGLMRYMSVHSGAGLYGRGRHYAGVQVNRPIDRLLDQNFQVCLQTPYNSVVSLDDIQDSCTGSTLAMACREVGSANLQVLAMGDRNQVFENTGESDTPNPHNSVNWYYSENESWGFAPGGEPINRASCDTVNPDSGDRLCWHTGPTTLNSGYRCGSNTNINNATYERIILQRDGDVPAP